MESINKLKATVETDSSNPFATSFSCPIPANWDIDAFLIAHPPKVKYHSANPQKIKDKLIYIASAYFRSRDVLANAEDLTDEDFIALNSSVLQSVIRDYNRYLDYLLHHQILEHDGKGFSDHNSRRFRLTAKYRQQETKIYTIFDRQIIKQATKYRLDKSTIKQFPELYQWLDHLSIDKDKAREKLEQLKQEGIVTDIRKHLNYVDAIQNKSKWLFRQGDTGRLYTHVCFMKRELREFLRYNGTQKLVKIDVKNCLPFISLAILDKKIFDKLEILKLIETTNNKYFCLYLNSFNSLTLVKIHSEEHIFEDVALFRQEIVEGTLYDYVRDEYDSRHGCYFKRDIAKRKILNVLNRPPDMQDKWSEVLDILFPNVMQAFRELSTGYWKIKKGKGKRKWEEGDQVSPFAHLTQRLESSLILEDIVNTIIQYDSTIPLYTIHDCIMTTPEHAKYVEDTLKSRFRHHFGVAPEVTVDDPKRESMEKLLNERCFSVAKYRASFPSRK